MKILTAEQIRNADKYTIEHLPITSIDLMEQAAAACYQWIIQNIDKKNFIYIFSGPGNNGGDGLALGRMLVQGGYSIKVFLLNTSGQLSPDCQTNLQRIKSIDKQLVEEFTTVPYSFVFSKDAVIIDALFGTGLTHALDTQTSNLVGQINSSGLPVISIDLPSGIYSDKTSLLSGYKIVKASTTLTFQYMKLGLLVEENAPYFGKVEVLDIGLMNESTASMDIKKIVTDQNLISGIYKPKEAFSHKGNFGHAMLVAGGVGKMGAAILAAKGYLKSGAGLLTVMIPQTEINIIQSAVPEAMACDYDAAVTSEITLPKINFATVGAGPGIGTGQGAVSVIDALLNHSGCPLVLDADALNILSVNPSWFSRLPEESILTPHLGEFKRIAGQWYDDFEKLKLQSEFSIKYNVYVVLKGKNTSIACPDGLMFFNPTGNAGMAKGGSGDVLTGILTGLVSAGYAAKEACILGVYLHGLAGDLAAQELTQEAMNAGDLVDHLPGAWKAVNRRP